MSYKDELKKQIEQLETSIEVDKMRLNALHKELMSLSMKEKAEAAFGQQQLLQG